MNLLNAALTGDVDFEKYLAVIRGARGFLVLDLAQVPVSEQDVRIARNQKQLLGAVRLGKVAQEFVSGQHRRGRGQFLHRRRSFRRG